MKKVFLLFMLIVSMHSFAQINDQYNNPALWTEADDPLGRMGFVGNRLRWTLTWNDIPNIPQSNLRCSRNLNNLISGSANFRVAVTYRILNVLQTGTTVLAITENNTQSLVTRLTNTTFNCTQNSSITINMNGNAFFIQIKPNGAVPLNGSCNPIFQQQINFNPLLNQDYRLELTQIGSRYRFRVLNPTTNAELVNQVFCSPVVPSNLNLIQHGNHPWAGVNGGQLEVDDLLVENAVTDPTINAFPTVAINGSRVLCGVDNQSVTLTANSSTPSATIRWINPASNSSSVSVSSAGLYRAEASLGQCSSIAEVNVVDSCSGCEDSCSWSKIGNRNVKAYNFIGTRNSADFKIRTNNLERMTVEANGNVGIGTDLPSEQLHTTNGVRFQGLTPLDTPNRVIVQDNTGKLFWRNAATIGNNGNFWSITGNSNAINPGISANQNYIGTSTNHRLVFGTGNINNTTSERMTILNNTGNVGIGISNPSILSKLHIVNEVNWGANSSVLGTYNQAKVSGVAGNLGNTWAHAASMNEFEINTSGVFNDVNANGGSSIAANNFTIFKRSTGTINVPVTGCISTLGLDGSGRINQYSAYRDRGAVALWGSGNSCTVDNYYGLYLSAIPQNLLTQTTGRAYGIYQLGNTSTNIFEGNVGIGTLTPNNKLEITHTTVGAGNTGNSGLRFTNLRSGFTPITNPGTGVLSVNANGDVVYVAAPISGLTNSCSTANTNIVPKYNGANSITCSQIFDNGTSVGINTTTGFAYTSLAGARLGATVPTSTGTVRMDVNGVLRSTMSIVTSDGTLKTNIKELKDALSIVSALNGKTYSWSVEAQKEKGIDNGTHIGFIAQEIQKVLPELVIEDENKKLGVNYTEVIPVLVEALKELNAKVEKQNNAVVENEELKAKIAVMEEKFALLEKTMTQLCESGCAGLKKSEEAKTSEVDVLYQPIPNPTDDVALINYSLSSEYREASITVSSQDGKQLMTLKLDAKKGAGSVKVSLRDLASGTYLYTLVAGNKVVDTKRLQIVK